MKEERPARSIFTEARFKVLRTLDSSPSGVSLREIAYRSGLAVRTVQTALSSLKAYDLVSSSAEKRRLVYKLNGRHSDAAVFTSLFDQLSRKAIAAQSSQDSTSNAGLLDAVSEMGEFAHQLRKDSGH